MNHSETLEESSFVTYCRSQEPMNPKNVPVDFQSNGIPCVKLGGSRGIPDRMVILQGVLIFFEFKKKGSGLLSVHQVLWGQFLQAMGHPYYVVTSTDEAIEILHKWIELKG